jgi:hypothetical protein
VSIDAALHPGRRTAYVRRWQPLDERYGAVWRRRRCLLRAVAIFGNAAVALGQIEKNEKLYAEGSIRINEWTTATGERRVGFSWRHGARSALGWARISQGARFQSREECRRVGSVIGIWCARLLADMRAAPRRSEVIHRNKGTRSRSASQNSSTTMSACDGVRLDAIAANADAASVHHYQAVQWPSISRATTRYARLPPGHYSTEKNMKA